MEIEVFKHRKYRTIQRASKRPRASSDFANEFIGVQPFPADVPNTDLRAKEEREKRRDRKRRRRRGERQTKRKREEDLGRGDTEVIEAMQFGKPVFVSNYTSLPEIASDYGFV